LPISSIRLAARGPDSFRCGFGRASTRRCMTKLGVAFWRIVIELTGLRNALDANEVLEDASQKLTRDRHGFETVGPRTTWLRGLCACSSIRSVGENGRRATKLRLLRVDRSVFPFAYRLHRTYPRTRGSKVDCRSQQRSGTRTWTLDARCTQIEKNRGPSVTGVDGGQEMRSVRSRFHHEPEVF
jgi:hypothetical protein